MCGAMLAAAILILIGGVREWRIGSASSGWPETEGVITHEKLVKTFRWEGSWRIWSAVYEREVSVRYFVNGTHYSSDFRLPNDSSDAPVLRSSSGDVIASASNSKCITLFYNPRNPSEVTLHRDVHLPAAYDVVFGGTAILPKSGVNLARHRQIWPENGH